MRGAVRLMEVQVEESLVEAQQAFAVDVARLILRAHELGIGLSLDEAYRPPEVAKLYAQQGRGISNSLHCDKLAVDLNAFVGGKLVTTQEGYAALGAFWKSLSPLNAWGGDFRSRDYRHFSRSRGGRQ